MWFLVGKKVIIEYTYSREKPDTKNVKIEIELFYTR